MKENQTIKLYNGEVELFYDDDKHTYTNVATGQILNGVTSVLKVIDKSDALVPWAVKTDLEFFKEEVLKRKVITREQMEDIMLLAKKEHERSRDDSASFGTSVHGYIESHIKGTDYLIADPLIQARVDSFKAMVKDLGLEFVDSERIVMSRKYGYCGTTDIIGHYQGKLFVMDIKTNTVKGFRRKTGIYDTYWFQTAAYQQAIEEETGMEVDGRMVIRVGEDATEVGIEEGRASFKKHLKAFLAAQSLYNILNESKSKG